MYCVLVGFSTGRPEVCVSDAERVEAGGITLYRINGRLREPYEFEKVVETKAEAAEWAAGRNGEHVDACIERMAALRLQAAEERVREATRCVPTT